MRGFTTAIIVGAGLVGQALTAPVDDPNGYVEVAPNPDSREPYHSSSFNRTQHPNDDDRPVSGQGTRHLNIKFQNNQGAALNGYILGQLTDGTTHVMLKTDGSYYKVPTGGNGQPINAPVVLSIKNNGATFTLPDYLKSARAFVSTKKLTFIQNSDGSIGQPAPQNKQDPNADIDYGFVEFDNDPSAGIFANPSGVDVIGLPLGLGLSGSAGKQSIPGLPKSGVADVCKALKNAASPNAPWGNLCQAKGGEPLRAVSPNFYASSYKGYWTEYVNKVYQKYASTPLTVTGNDNVKYTCKVSGGAMNCGAAGTFAKPNAADIFGCASGPFTNGGSDARLAVVPVLCAAFNRGTLLLQGGANQPGGVPISKYYTSTPSNQYAKFVHKFEVGGKGYAFAYDDVSPSGTNAAGVLTDGNPTALTVVIGGPN